MWRIPPFVTFNTLGGGSVRRTRGFCEERTRRSMMAVQLIMTQPRKKIKNKVTSINMRDSHVRRISVARYGIMRFIVSKLCSERNVNVGWIAKISIALLLIVNKYGNLVFVGTAMVSLTLQCVDGHFVTIHIIVILYRSDGLTEPTAVATAAREGVLLPARR